MATAPVTEAVSCSLENYLVLPDRSMDARIAEAKAALGNECVILGHHYQRDEVVRYADYRGDSYRLSQMAAQARGSYIVFCGVHFMAESADILARPGQAVVLPDLNAGCSMADMAEISQVEDAWDQFVNLGLADDEGAGHHAHHLHEFDSGHQGFLRRTWRHGLHLIERQGRIRLGFRPQ